MKGRTYRYFDGDVLYPFGHGLSYTRFNYSGLTIDKTTADADEAIEVAVTVENAGAVAGDEVVQLYVRALDSRLQAPLKQLRGIDRISLEPGQRRQVRFTLTPSKDLSQYDAERQAFIAQPGEYEIQIGASSQDVRLTKRVQVR